MARTASIGIRVEPELKAAVEKAATADGRTVAQWIERLIVQQLKTEASRPAARPSGVKLRKPDQ